MGLFDSFSSSSSTTPTESSSKVAASTASLESSSAKTKAPSPSADASNKFVTPLNPTGIKPCCACPDTKGPRDECFLKYGHEGEESWRCKDLVEAHRKCMKSLGYNI